LPGHTTFDLTLGKDFGERFSASVNAINHASRRVELDNSVTFGGFHWNNPREVYVELRYRFHCSSKTRGECAARPRVSLGRPSAEVLRDVFRLHRTCRVRLDVLANHSHDG
jgi:hypothetical protein